MCRNKHLVRRALNKDRRMPNPRNSKRFNIWMPLKERIHFTGRKWEFREKEIWWMAMGENVGTEVNGKGDSFSRPVLIIRKYGPGGFFGVPLSSQIHKGMWYITFKSRGREQCALLSQAGSFCSYRLYGFIGRISKKDYRRVIIGLEKLLFKK